MRRLFLYCACICLLAAGCGNTDTESVVNESFVNEMESDSLASGSTDEKSEKENPDHSEVPDLPAVSDPNGIEYESLPDDIKGMLIPIDSLLLYNVEIGGEYKPEDPEMFWQTMHYMFGNFGEFYAK